MNDYFTTQARLLASRILIALVKQIVLAGDRIDEYTKALTALRHDLAALDERNPEFTRMTAAAISLVLAYSGLVLGAGLLDYFLLGSLGVFIASLSFSNRLLITIASLMFPTTIVAVEVWLSIRIAERRQEHGTRDNLYRLFLGLGCLLTLIVPIASVTIAATAASAFSGKPPLMLFAAIGTLSTLAHLGILFSSDAATGAKGLLVYTAQRLYLTTKLAHAKNAEAHELRKFKENAIEYCHRLTAFQEQFGPYPIGPFTETARRLLREFGLGGGPDDGPPTVTP